MAKCRCNVTNFFNDFQDVQYWDKRPSIGDCLVWELQGGAVWQLTNWENWEVWCNDN